MTVMPFKSDSRKNDSRPKSRPAGAKPETGRFSHMLAIETVPDNGLDVRIWASKAERAALAVQCGVASVESFEADFHVHKEGRGRYGACGKLKARVTQICVVSLEPFESEIAADIDVAFAPPSGSLLEPSAGRGDPPDPIVNGQIDLGALAAEFLLLNLDPYPRKPGAVFEAAESDEKASKQESPFAVLLRR
jgi:uncharacterized metal-binding protein YceD (DUF177 family)